MRAIHVLFYSPQPDDHWLNHLVTYFSPPYSHCDLQFEDGTASSIYQNESVYLERKSFSRLNYHRVSLSVTDAEYSQILHFCQRAHQTAVGFDFTGMVMAYLPYSPRQPPDKTFCSRFIAEALQQTGRQEFLAARPASITPSGLHALLTATNKGFLHVSEARLQRMRELSGR
jgi:hypothetical protein